MKASWTRDEHGIPQIVTDDIVGLYWGMGYCHAMDRGMQMLITRILGQGRAAELLDGLLAHRAQDERRISRY